MAKEETHEVQVHKVTLLIVDHDGLGAAEAAQILENARYPNHCMHPTVLAIRTKTVDWHDQHPLNITTNTKRAAAELFGDPPPRCCPGDNDGDGDCRTHAAPGVPR